MDACGRREAGFGLRAQCLGYSNDSFTVLSLGLGVVKIPV